MIVAHLWLVPCQRLVHLQRLRCLVDFESRKTLGAKGSPGQRARNASNLGLCNPYHKKRTFDDSPCDFELEQENIKGVQKPNKTLAGEARNEWSFKGEFMRKSLLQKERMIAALVRAAMPLVDEFAESHPSREQRQLVLEQLREAQNTIDTLHYIKRDKQLYIGHYT